MSKKNRNHYDQYGSGKRIILENHREGTTEMPFWKDDLKFEAILALMETIDMKNFDDLSAFEQYIKQTEELLERVKGWG